MRGAAHERRLLLAARRGDRSARDRLVAAHLHHVRGVASRYRGLGLPYEDLLQEGALGLLDAVDRYDADRAMPFETFARFRIRRSIRNALSDQSRLIRLPRNVVDRRRALARSEERITAAGLTTPLPEDLSADTGLPPTTIRETLAAPTALLTLDGATGSDGRPIVNPVADDNAVDPAERVIERERAGKLAAALAALPQPRRRVIEESFGLGCEPRDLADLASSMHVTPQRVRSIKNSALHELHVALAAVEGPDSP
jgi:RNA polymerase primary sigma factor